MRRSFNQHCRMRLLVTGASGFVGWNAVRRFAERGHDMLATYVSSSHYLHHVAGCQPVHLDLMDGSAIDLLVARFQPNLILHAAACSRPQQSTDAARVHAVNVTATGRLAAAARACDAGLVYLSTDLVYPADAGLCDERTPTQPSGAGSYAHSKLLGEQAVAASGARAVIIRCALMFGHGTDRSNSFSQFIDRAWQRGEAAPLFTDQFRSFLFVDDLLEAIERVAIDRPAWGELYVCGGEERLSRAEFGLRYADALGVDRGRCAPMRSSELAGYVGGGSDISLDTAKLRATGWRPRSLEDCLAEMLRSAGRE